jgi:DNA-binding NarL/FixJ family response regulator
MLELRLRESRDFELVGRATESDDILELARAATPDFIVLGVEGALPLNGSSEIFSDDPKVRVLALETRAGRAFLCELVRDVSPDDVVEVLRRAAGRGALL